MQLFQSCQKKKERCHEVLSKKNIVLCCKKKLDPGLLHCNNGRKKTRRPFFGPAPQIDPSSCFQFPKISALADLCLGHCGDLGPGLQIMDQHV